MSRVVELLCSRRTPQVAVLALMSFGFAGCSADMQTRLSQNSFSNPFSSQPETTASVAAPTPQVERRELPQYARPQPQYQSSALPPPIAAPQSYPAAGVSGGGRGVASYTPPARQPIETTGSVAPRSIAATRAPGREAGTTIIVGTSDTMDALAHRYGVTSAEILKANGYKGPRALQPGQQLIIPPRAIAAAPVAVAPKAVAVAAPVAAPPVITPPSVHVVNRGDTLMSIAHRNHVPVAELAKANSIDANSKLKLGQKINVPGAKSAAAPAAAQPAQVAGAQPGAVAAPATKMAAVEPAKEKARLAQATTTPEAAAAVTETPVKTAEATGALPTFRWPVRGRVVTGYGAKTNGKSNDGINVAVPEGTPVKAAEDGVVAYSGNELKGYGNLILVRHSNGYVTAYAHASELLVKRGETIKRGQIIAKSGQSGEVGSPQLHFEIRKGSSPVDPLQFLNGA
jgi:murein DD-endopeptidase MepM/ murein hydrolase activator NlpD